MYLCVHVLHFSDRTSLYNRPFSLINFNFCQLFQGDFKERQFNCQKLLSRISYRILSWEGEGDILMYLCMCVCMFVCLYVCIYIYILYIVAEIFYFFGGGGGGKLALGEIPPLYEKLCCLYVCLLRSQCSG